MHNYCIRNGVQRTFKIPNSKLIFNMSILLLKEKFPIQVLPISKLIKYFKYLSDISCVQL